MSDYLDAHQAARLECLKMLSASARGASPADFLRTAEVMARFIMDGTVPSDDDREAAA